MTQGRLDTTGTYQRTAVGIAVTVAGLVLLLAALLPLRVHLSIATPALVFVLPALVGVVIGGSIPGVVGAVAGFALYDWFFLPPYDTFTVRSPQNWLALVVYVAVVLIASQLVANMRRAREVALRRTAESERLYELSQALIGDLTLAQLLAHIVETVQDAFQPQWTALVLPDEAQNGELSVAAAAGQTLTAGDVASLTSGGGQTTSLGLTADGGPRQISVALVVNNRPVGMLVLHQVQLAEGDRGLLGTFANQAALAVDRAQLREQALRARLLEEVDTWRSALMGAASHDLRTPLASIKTSVSNLRQPAAHLTEGDRAELLELIEVQSDRLARLVTNLLDMTRIEAGALELRAAPIAFDELVDEALGSLGGVVDTRAPPAPTRRPISRSSSSTTCSSARSWPTCSRTQVASTLDAGTIRVSAKVIPGSPPWVEIAVADDGPGIKLEDRERVFEMFSQNGGGGRAGLGLAIAQGVRRGARRGHLDRSRGGAGRPSRCFTVPGAGLRACNRLRSGRDQGSRRR